LGTLLASQGWQVILDAKYDRQQLRQTAIAQAQEYQLPLQIIYCMAPIEVLQQRLSDRTGDIADATADLLVSQINQADPFTDKEQSYIKVLNTTQPLQTQLTEIIEGRV
jgi:predicted kinase